ncbi:MAG TPA: AsmA family protein [Terriglobales bacterium]|nr:AsmA family protein [Terriglobales bacterium]
MKLSKRNLKIAGIVVAVLLVILIALPLFININSFRPKIESEATNALGRPVKLGNLSLSILTGTVGVDDISIADDPAFSKSPFVTAKSLKVGVELMPLIFSKQLNVTGIALDEPQIMLLKAVNGTWNFSSLGGAGAKKVPETEKTGASAPQNFSVAKLEIKDGKLTVGKANSTAKPQVYDKLNVEVTNFSLASQFPFELTASLPGGGNAKVSGKAGPINPQDAAKTPLDGSVKVNNMDLAASGLASGIGGVADFDGTLNSNGSQGKAVGLVTCDKLKLSPKGSPASKTVTIKYTVNADLDQQAGTITQGDVAIGKAVAHLTGGFQTQGEVQVVNLKLSAPDMPVDELEAMLPALGIVLPSGSQLQGGTLSTELAISGPVDKLVITGPVRLANSKLAGFDLGSKLGALSAFTGKAPANRDTSIQNASLNARVAPEGTRADAINLTVPAIGVITGAGTVSPAGALDFRMLANLQGGMAGGLTQRAGIGGGTGSGIPFSIQGTTSNPSFVPDVSGVAGSVAKGAVQNAVSGKTAGTQGLGGLLGRKKPK